MRSDRFDDELRFEEELNAEVSFHLEARADASPYGWMTAQAAQTQARRQFGNRLQSIEESRRAWRSPSFVLTRLVTNIDPLRAMRQE